MTPADLIAFEADIAAEFNAGRIRAPIHLAGGNELALIRIFDGIAPQDWIATTWRSHYHCLLKGVPPERLKADIMAGRSIALSYPEHRIVSSAIVGGSLPIALGIALSIKRAGGKERVWAFCGDMASTTGIFAECVSYAAAHKLPVVFTVEDNAKSVCTDTAAVWAGRLPVVMAQTGYYRYELPWPHSGAGVRVQF